MYPCGDFAVPRSVGMAVVGRGKEEKGRKSKTASGMSGDQRLRVWRDGEWDKGVGERDDFILIEKRMIDGFQTVTIYLDELDLGPFQQNRAN